MKDNEKNKTKSNRKNKNKSKENGNVMEKERIAIDRRWRIKKYYEDKE